MQKKKQTKVGVEIKKMEQKLPSSSLGVEIQSNLRIPLQYGPQTWQKTVTIFFNYKKTIIRNVGSTCKEAN